MRVPVISVIILFLFSFLVDWYIWSDIRKYASQKHRKTYGIVYAVLSALLWIYLIVVVCLPRRDVGESITPVMWMLFSYFTVYISKFVYMVCSLIGRLFRKHVNYGAYIGIGLGLLTGFSMMWGALVTRYDIEVTHADIYSDRLPKDSTISRSCNSATHMSAHGETTLHSYPLLLTASMPSNPT